MPTDFDDLQAQIETLTREVVSIQQRLNALEDQTRSRRHEADAEPLMTLTSAAPIVGNSQNVDVPKDPSQGTIPLIGRTLIVLGGAFIFRALTEASMIPPLGGAIAGLLYATWWLVQADRAANSGKRRSAAFHAFATAIIAYPLIWETTARFELLNTSVAAIILVSVHYFGLAVAWRRKLQTAAWTFTLFSAATATALLFGTHDLIPFVIALLVVAIGIESLAFQNQWLELRWPIALTLDLCLMLMITMTTRPDGPPPSYAPLPPLAVIITCSLLPTVYFGSIVARTLLHDHVIRPFEFVQASLAFLVGVGGAVKVTNFMGATLTPAALSILFLGAASYATSFTAIDRRSGRGRNFYSYTTLAAILILFGSTMLMRGHVLAISWSMLAVATTVVGRSFDRITLKFHSAIYMVAAAIACDLLTSSSTNLLANPTSTLHSISPTCAGVVALTGLCYVILATTPGAKTSSWYLFLPQAALAALLVWSAAGVAAEMLSGLFARQEMPTALDPSIAAATRPSVLAILAILLAWASHHWSLKELTWLVYPILILGGVKLLWEGLQYSEPAALVIAFALYGGALVVTPRLTKLEF